MKPLSTTLWINDGRIEEAATFYLGALDGARETGSNDYGPDAGPYAGQKMVVRIDALGHQWVLLNGGDTSFVPNESVSFVLECEDQAEVDRYWERLVDGGEPSMCGWLKDRFGFSWQVVPSVLFEMMDDPDPEKVRRVTACFMAVERRPFDIAELRAAYEG